MIKTIDNYFILETKDTSYIFYKNKIGHLEHLYYGKRINIDTDSLNSLKEEYSCPLGNAIDYSDDNKGYFLEFKNLEYSTLGKGDIRSPQIEIEYSNGSRTSDFLFDSYKVNNFNYFLTLPQSKDVKEELTISLKDKENNSTLYLIYRVFEEENVITRCGYIKNESDTELKIVKAYSFNIDMKNESYNLRSFHGEWNNEMNIYDQKLVIGEYSNYSICGTSSNRCNPFFIIFKDGCSEDNGKCYGFNLIYSGNHRSILEVDSLNNLRILDGINPDRFSYTLKHNEVFEIPEAVLTFSSEGFDKLSSNMHNYINNHIIEKNFRGFPTKSSK